MGKYRVIYKGYNGEFNLSEKEMNLEEARKFKEKCIKAGFPTVHIIKIIE